MNLRKLTQMGAAVIALLFGLSTATNAQIRHVIHISVDGLIPLAVTTLGPGLAPNFYRLRTEGTFTDNARTDADIANTLPDHASELTGRPVFGSDGHGLFINDDPGNPITLQVIKGSYVASVFDAAHDAGLTTALFANKGKFEIFDRSWNELNGAPDRIAPDNGRDKIDTYFFHPDMNVLAGTFIAEMAAQNYNYVLVHLREPDSTGHGTTWDLSPGSDYLNAVVSVDGILGQVIELVQSSPDLVGNTAIIVTSDHGGEIGTDFHFLLPDFDFIMSGIVPFYVWGPGVPAGADLYILNPSTTKDPGLSIPDFSELLQPVRNGDSANLALKLLGLPPIPGSKIKSIGVVINSPPHKLH